MVRILIVEDEFKLADVIASRLRKEKIESNVIMLTTKSMLENLPDSTMEPTTM